MTTTKTSIDTTGKKLTTVLTELIAQPNAFARLPRGLVLAWRIVDGTRALFTMTRAGASAIILASSAPTSVSEGDSPSRRMLVESQMRASTPSSPISRRRFSSVVQPDTGEGSIFQSPVWKMRP